jgi:PAS domain S-box-containing protein
MSRSAEKATARFARLSESGVVGTVVIDLDDRRIVDINDALLNMIGYARDDFSSGRVSWTSLTPPGWGEVDARALEQLATSGVSGLREKEFIRKDGRRIPVLAGSAMLGDGTRECISFVLDLSERKEAERAQREAERRSERIVKSATVGMWMFDAEGRTTFMNPRMAEILGVTVTGALLKPVTDFARPDDPPTIDERLKGWKAGLPSAFEQTFWRADESAVVLWVEASPMHDAEGRFEGVISIVTDITARRDMEEQLKASEARYRLMFDQSPLAKWLYDATTLRFLDVNVAAIRDLGYDREEYLGMTLKDLRAPAEAPPLDDLHRHAGDRSEFTTLRLRRKSGEVLEFEMTSHAITVGNRLCRLAVGRDVTERCRLEEQLRQAQKMEAVGRLAGGVAHDFNNVLSVILTYAELMLSDLNDDDPMRSEVQEIKTAAERARDLTRQLLMFSRQQVVAPKVLDLNDVVTRMEKMLQRLLGADVDLVSRPSRPLRRVRADPTSVEQVILNLVVNARDAMPTGGQLTMETADVVLDEAYAERHLGVKAGPYVMLAVTDTGTGIEKAVQARIFEPFFTTKEAGKGTGLGLSTVFGIVQQCGGSVWVYSEVGRGTTFKVYFPSVDADVESGHRMEAPTRRGSETILLVEDDDQVRKVAQGILRRSGYRIREARNAGEALLHSEQHAGTIDLLLSDVVMPQMSGPTLAMRLASARPGMKVLCMSGYTDDSIVRHGVLDAKIAFLQKPITTETLTSKVREVLDARAKEEEPEKR